MSMTKDPENPAPGKSSLSGSETVPSSPGTPWSLCMGKRRDLSSSVSLLPECYGLNVVFFLRQLMLKSNPHYELLKKKNGASLRSN